VENECDNEYSAKRLLLFYFSVSHCDISILSVRNNIWYGILGAHNGEDS